MPTIQKTSRTQLAEILRNPKNFRGTSFVGFDALTEMKLNKTLGSRTELNPHFGKVFKRLSSQLAIVSSDKTGSLYENTINRRLDGDNETPNFEVGERSWGGRVAGTSLIEHTKVDGIFEQYLFVIYHQSPVTLAAFLEKEHGITLSETDRDLMNEVTRPAAFESKSGNVEYLLKGADGSMKPIAFEDIQGKPPAKKEANMGGLREELKPIPRSFKLKSLTRVTMSGVTHLIED